VTVAARQDGAMHALVSEAMKKAAIVWVTTSVEGTSYPMWCLPVDGALAVVIGGDEQPAPGLVEANTAIVSARGDHGGRIVRWRVRIETIEPGTEQWIDIATPLAGKRLNASGPVEALVAKWTVGSVIARLVPIDDTIEAAQTSSGAAVPRPTPAANRT